MPDLNRRRFGTVLAGVGAALAASPAGAAAPDAFVLAPNGWVPNNPHLPVLLYRGVLAGTLAGAAGFERRVAATGWPAQWRNGIYDFHHYHSTAHEVLGIAAGEATITLGGPNGRILTLGAGDVAVLPTGTGHCLVRASDDLLVVGAYPDGQHWDICREAPDAAAANRMLSLPFPLTDPIDGEGGPLTRLWT